jgi:hypothetical protein
MNKPKKAQPPSNQYRTKNRRLILRVLSDQPQTTKQIHETLSAVFQSQLFRIDKLPSLLQTYRTTRELFEGGVITREKQDHVFRYSRR